jgi:7-carboxy-7-deazaguanine synthase
VQRDSDSLRLAVNEVFVTVQGEAHFQGTPCVFIRLQGCPVGCPWCDTKYTWFAKSSKVVAFDKMLGKEKDSIKYAMASIDEIVRYVEDTGLSHVVLTGGEPCQQDIYALTELLESKRITCQVETSGTFTVDVSDLTWVTVSPKYAMPGGLPVKEQALVRADELKFPIDGKQDLLAIDEARRFNSTATVWVQPVSQKADNVQLCMDYALAGNRARVSIQTHKYIGVR